MQRYILHNLLLLVHVALGYRDVLLSLEIELSRVGIRTSDALYRARVGLDVDDVAQTNALLLYRLVYRWVESQLLGALCGFEVDEEM